MAARRVSYGAAVLAALAFQIFYDGYLAQFLLAAVLALPLFSLAVSLPGLARIRLSLSCATPRLLRGGQGQWLLAITSRAFVPISRLSLELRFDNALTGASRRERLRLFGLSQGQRRALPMDPSHCGQLSCRVVRARALDALGLFSFPVPLPQPALALVLPQPDPGPPPVQLERLAGQAGSSPHRGQPGEDYELRDYRPGDPIRDIHWKLSSKREQLVLRERTRDSRPRITLAVELFGDPARLDRALGRLWSVSRWLLARQLPHQVLWLDAGQRACQRPVLSQEGLDACLEALLSRPAPAARPDTPLEPGSGLHLTITGEEVAAS